MEEKSRQQQIEEFEQQRKAHASDWLKSIREAKRCAWCGWEDNLNRRRLCVSCERIRRRLAKANKENTSDQRVSRIRRLRSRAASCTPANRCGPMIALQMSRDFRPY